MIIIDTMIWEILSIFGDIQFWVGTILTSLLLLFTIPQKARKHISWFVFQTLPAIMISYGVVQVLKYFLKIPRPCVDLVNCPSGFSFPSGHATVIFTAVTVLSLHYKDKRLVFFMYIFAIFVALSRIMLNVHRIEDIIFGSMIGLIIGWLVERVYINYQQELSGLIKN